MTNALKAIEKLLRQKSTTTAEKIDLLNDFSELIQALGPFPDHAVSAVRWVPIEKVSPNNYNPNKVAGREMGLLYTSIKNDGLTQPVVTIYDPQRDLYVIIDGFHRYFTTKSNPDILQSTFGRLPVVVLNKDPAECMAATVRHNRARGVHSVERMSNLVFKMLDEGLPDYQICNELGMEPEELLKLKHITGFSKLFENVDYSKAWKKRSQIHLEKKHGVLGKAK